MILMVYKYQRPFACVWLC